MKNDLLIRLTVIKVYIMHLLFSFLRVFVPKKEKELLFIPSHQVDRFSGNLKSFYDYIAIHQPDYSSYIFLTKKCSQQVTYPTVSGTLSLLWRLVRAEYVIIDGSNPYLISKQLSVIQLWHGCGLKNVGLSNQNTDKNLLRLFERHFATYRLVTALSEYDANKHNHDFKTDKAQVTGIARNDVFFQSESGLEALRAALGIVGFRRIITYAPTFRDHFTVANFTEPFWKELNSLLANNNDCLLIKKHPWDRFLIVPEGLSHIRDISSVVDDVQQLLIVTDLLISDYSSIVTDYVITKRPVLYYLFDHALYLSTCRSMSDPIEELLPGPFIYDERMLLDYLAQDTWMEDPELKLRSTAFMHKFHHYFDGHSCARIFAAMVKLK